MAVKIYKIGDKVYHDYDKYISAMRGETTTTTKKPTTTSTTSTIPKAPPPRRPERGTDPRLTPTTTTKRPTTTTSTKKKTPTSPLPQIKKIDTEANKRIRDIDRTMEEPRRSKPPTKKRGK